MARIRSVHPGLWTDEAFVSLSLVARLFLIGMWNEADDYGLFEWKPTRLKMRLAPNDPINAAEIMDELAAAGFLQRLDRDKPYGLVRNFRKYQRPKTPSAPLFPVDDAIISAIGITDTASIPKAHRSPSPVLPQSGGSPSEKSALMEDGGGRVEEEGEKLASLAQDARAPSDFDRFWSEWPKSETESKAKARKAWGEIDDRPEIETLLACVAEFKVAAAKENRKYLPHAATWLTDRGWEHLADRAAAQQAQATATESARAEKIPPEWREAAGRIAEKRGWPFVDAMLAGGMSLTVDNGTPTLTFDRKFSHDFAKERGWIDVWAQALGVEPPEPYAIIRGVEAKPAAPEPDPLEIPAFLVRKAAA